MGGGKKLHRQCNTLVGGLHDFRTNNDLINLNRIMVKMHFNTFISNTKELHNIYIFALEVKCYLD